MKEPEQNVPSKEALVVLDSLQRAVTQALEKKRRLGQYAVIWQNGKPVTVGDDAPGQRQ
jgi:hypothetical protein